MIDEIDTSGEDLEKNPPWHVEESPWKAKQLLHMINQSGIAARTSCEVGWGGGEVLKQLQEKMDPTCSFCGYEVSPQAFELSKPRANERLHFKLADISKEEDVFFDLILILDVIEHLEDYFSFLRDLRPKSRYKIIHLPLDLSVQSLLRRNSLLGVRTPYGHIHYFTQYLPLHMLKDLGYELLEYFYAPRAIGLADNIAKKLLILPRVIFFSIHKDLAVRILGGYSLLVLAK